MDLGDLVAELHPFADVLVGGLAALAAVVPGELVGGPQVQAGLHPVGVESHLDVLGTDTEPGGVHGHPLAGVVRLLHLQPGRFDIDLIVDWGTGNVDQLHTNTSASQRIFFNA